MVKKKEREEEKVEMKKREKKDKEVTVHFTISFDDFDELYKEMDPNTPIGLRNGKPIVPGVKSWSELFHETVPMPYKCFLLPSGEVDQSVHGGVTTANIPVQHVNTSKSIRVTGTSNPLAASQNLSEVQVGASASKEQIVYKNYKPPPAQSHNPVAMCIVKYHYTRMGTNLFMDMKMELTVPCLKLMENHLHCRHHLDFQHAVQKSLKKVKAKL